MSDALPINWDLLIFVLSSYKIITHRANDNERDFDTWNEFLWIISFFALIVTGHRIPPQLTDIGHLFIFVLSSYNCIRYRSIANKYIVWSELEHRQLYRDALRTRRRAGENLFFSFIALVVTGINLIRTPLPDIARSVSSLVLAVRSLVSRGSSLPSPDISGIDFIASLRAAPFRTILGCYFLSEFLWSICNGGVDAESMKECVLGVTCFHSWQLYMLACTTMRMTYGQAWFQGYAFEISLDIIFILFLVVTGANLASLPLPDISGFGSAAAHFIITMGAFDFILISFVVFLGARYLSSPGSGKSSGSGDGSTLSGGGALSGGGNLSGGGEGGGGNRSDAYDPGAQESDSKRSRFARLRMSVTGRKQEHVDQIDLTQLTRKEKKYDPRVRAVIQRQLRPILTGENYKVAGVDGSAKFFDGRGGEQTLVPRSHGISGCNCNNWLNYWCMMALKGDEPGTCGVLGCTKPTKFGLHVWVKYKDRDKCCYILPGCREHNKKIHDLKVKGGAGDYPMETKESAILVPTPLTDRMRKKLKKASM